MKVCDQCGVKREPTARDLEKARRIHFGVVHDNTPDAYERGLAFAMAAERASLPESVREAIEHYAKGRHIWSESETGPVSKPIGYHAQQALEDLRKWKAGEG